MFADSHLKQIVRIVVLAKGEAGSGERGEGSGSKLPLSCPGSQLRAETLTPKPQTLTLQTL